MSTTTAEEKAALRRLIRRQAAALSQEARQASDSALLARFLGLFQLARASTLLLFYGVDTEVATPRLLPSLFQMGKAVALPRCLPGRSMEARLITPETVLIPGPFGIPQPGEDCPVVPRDKLELILVPALCYDVHRFRLGQGGGYYDRFLAGFPGATVGLCREALLQPRLPREETDLGVGLVLTEARTFC